MLTNNQKHLTMWIEKAMQKVTMSQKLRDQILVWLVWHSVGQNSHQNYQTFQKYGHIRAKSLYSEWIAQWLPRLWIPAKKFTSFAPAYKMLPVRWPGNRKNPIFMPWELRGKLPDFSLIQKLWILINDKASYIAPWLKKTHSFKKS